MEAMMLQAKMNGADAVKVQLYSSQALFGDDRKEYAEITRKDLDDLRMYSTNIGIELFASVFDKSRIEWCEDLGFEYYKVATRSFEDEELVNAMISTGKPVFISNGSNVNDFRYVGDNVHYFYCTPQYPTLLEDVDLKAHLVDNGDFYEGFSDHTIGLTASMVAVVMGAKYIEKHFTISHAMQASFTKGNVGGMEAEELRRLRQFCDEYALMTHND
jgi:sialic acid synthase SpsE